MRRRRRVGGVPHLIFAVAATAGLAFGLGDRSDDPLPAEVEQAQRCEPVTYTDDERGAAQTLVDAGWTVVGYNLYPPGCESVR